MVERKITKKYRFDRLEFEGYPRDLNIRHRYLAAKATKHTK